MTGLRTWLEQILNSVAAIGFFAPMAFVPIYIIGTILFVPTALLTLAAGALFGVPIGFAVTLASLLASASGVFLAGRNLSREWVIKNVASNKKIQALDNLVAEKGWKIVLLLRLSAIFPFTILNYGLGLTKIRFKHYMLASLIGMVPGTLVYVYLGSLAGIMIFETHLKQKSPIEWALIALGLAATLGLAIYSTLTVKKSFRTLTIKQSGITGEIP